MTKLAIIALGGGVGALLRYGVSLWLPFPLGTLAVNLLGGFLIGLAFVWLGGNSPLLQPFLMVGLLGALTTFSTFSLDALRLVEGGQALYAAGYVLASVVLSLGAVFAAVALARGLS